MGSKFSLLWLASIVRGNSQQVRIVRGPEILSIKKNELENRKSWEKNQINDKKAIKKLWAVEKDQRCLGEENMAVKKNGGSTYKDY